MTSQRLQLYKCQVCGTIVQVLDGGSGNLVCCSIPMTLQRENHIDAQREPHQLVSRSDDRGLVVRVGDIPHPMEDSHFIEWIEVQARRGVYRQFLQPGQPPEACFDVAFGQSVEVRGYCSRHGLWKGAPS